tara:strand:- start:610 stop:1194 length:585 start_codon:yes stop_codon:yes gene_type:complete
MNDNILKKEWNKKDVQRARNLISGKTGERVTQGIGYSKKQEFYSEGDIWEENGKKWTIKDGIKQNVTKLDKIKKIAKTPMFCPECGGLMNHRFDNDYYKIHKMCFGCFTKFESELKIKGLWEDYFNKVHNGEIDNLISEFKDWVDNKLNESNESFVTEQGDVETWVGKPNEKRVQEGMKGVIEYLESLKKNNDK